MQRVEQHNKLVVHGRIFEQSSMHGLLLIMPGNKMKIELKGPIAYAGTHRVGIIVSRTEDCVDKRAAIVCPGVRKVHKLLEGKAGTIVHHLHIAAILVRP